MLLRITLLSLLLLLVIGLAFDANANKHKKNTEMVPMVKLKQMSKEANVKARVKLETVIKYHGTENNTIDVAACKAALQVCQDKLSACTECNDSWSSGYGVLCFSVCGEAMGACEAAEAACKTGDI